MILEIGSIIEYFKSINREWKRGSRREDFRRIVRSRKIYKRFWKSKALSNISKVLIECGKEENH